jgi:flagellar protein FliS
MSYNVLDAYRTVGLQTRAATASPHELILMLYDGGLAAIIEAKYQMQRRHILKKGQAITKAVAIVEELNASLNMEVGGALTSNLRSLYLYIMQRLLRANLENDMKILDEAHLLLANIRNGWAAMALVRG